MGVDLPLVGLLLQLRLRLLLPKLAGVREAYIQPNSKSVEPSLVTDAFNSTSRAKKGWRGSSGFGIGASKGWPESLGCSCAPKPSVGLVATALWATLFAIL